MNEFKRKYNSKQMYRRLNEMATNLEDEENYDLDDYGAYICPECDDDELTDEELDDTYIEDHELCPECEGDGCNSCNNTGYMQYVDIDRAYPDGIEDENATDFTSVMPFTDFEENNEDDVDDIEEAMRIVKRCGYKVLKEHKFRRHYTNPKFSSKHFQNYLMNECGSDCTATCNDGDYCTESDYFMEIEDGLAELGYDAQQTADIMTDNADLINDLIEQGLTPDEVTAQLANEN